MAHFYATCLKIAVNKLAAARTARLRRDPMRSRIGMFHAILPDGAPLSDEYACRISDLISTIDDLREKGFVFITLEDLLAKPFDAAMRGFCVLTFDDGYEGVGTLAAPLLTARGIPYTVYVTTDYLGREGYFSTEQLAALSHDPLCTVGSHLVTHPMTRFMSREAVLNEMTESKRLLERVTGASVRDLAFPYGSAYACSLRDILLAKRAGYASAALTIPTVLCRSIYRAYTLPRLNMFR